MEISILEPNPYEYNFSVVGRFPIYLRLKRTSDNKYFDIIHATKLNNWGVVHKVMNCYNRPIKFMYSGRDYENHLIIINPNNTSYISIDGITETEAFHASDYRATQFTNWLSVRITPHSFVIMDNLISNKTVNTTYTDSNVSRIKMYTDSAKTNNIDFMYISSTNTKKSLDLRKVNNISDDSNKYIQMVASASGSYFTATADNIEHEYMMIQFENAGEYTNGVERKFYPTRGFGDIDGTTPTVWYCPYIKMRKNNINNRLSKIKFNPSGSNHAIVTIVNSDDKLIVFNADRMKWDNVYVYNVEEIRNSYGYRLYQNIDDLVGIDIYYVSGGSEENHYHITSKPGQTYFPFSGMSLKFSHFSNLTSPLPGRMFNEADHTPENIVRLKNNTNDNILDVRTKDNISPYNMIPNMNLKTDYSHLIIPANTKVRLCNNTYNAIKDIGSNNPLQYSRPSGCTDISPSTTVAIGSYNSVYVNLRKGTGQGTHKISLFNL